MLDHRGLSHRGQCLHKANDLLRESDMPESEWLAAAIRRLRAVLAGRDVHSAGVYEMTSA